MIRIPTAVRAAMTWGALAATLPVSADWTHAHRDATGNAYVPVNATLTDPAQAPLWTTGPAMLNTGAPALAFDGRVYAVRFDTTGNKIAIVGFDRETGTQEFESADLDVGNSLSFGSLCSPTIDPAERAMYYGSGSSMQRLDLDAVTPATSVVWSTSLSAANTDPNGEYDIINSSPAVGTGKVFIKTFLGFLSTRESQLVAFDATSGVVSWFKTPGGPGNASPLFVDLGATQVVIVDAEDGSGNGGMAAFDATTGAEVWNHATVTVPWNTGARQFYGDFALSGGRVYAFSYDFGASGNLAIVDPATGAATIVSSIGTDCAPVIAGSTVYGIGGAYGDADIRGYDATSGAVLFTADLFGGNQFIFRNYLVALDDSLFCATDNGFGSAPNTHLLRLNPSNGAVLANSAAASDYTGAVTIDDDGAVFAFRQDGSLNGLAVPTTAGIANWTRWQ